MIELTLPDGVVAKFPDDTPTQEIEAAAREYWDKGRQKRGLSAWQGSLSRAGTFGTAPTQEDIAAGRRENIAGLTLAAMVAPAVIANPVAAAKATGWGVAGTAAGGELGHLVGSGLERAGLPKGTARVASTAGGVLGGLVGPFKGPAILGALAKLSPHSRLGMLARLAMGGEPAAVAAGAGPVAVAKAGPVAAETGEVEILAEQLAKQLRTTKDVARELVRRGLAAETAGMAAPATRGATALAPEVVTQPATPQLANQAEEIASKIVQWKTQNKWSGAQMESALRNVYGISPKDGREMIRRVLEAEGPSPLQAPRIQIGAQKVGRSLGMTKEEVRQQAGPVLDEALGEASPILPKKALQSIIDTMKAMPMAEREAYVARATSGKAKWQVENIRRTLEHLGLLLPLGVAGTALAKD